MIVNDGKEVALDRIVVCNLSDVASGKWAHEPPEDDPPQKKVAKIAVDPVLGRIAFPKSIAPQSPLVTFHYGFSANVGGGEYNRLDSFDDELQKSGKIIRVPANQPTIQAALDTLGADDGVVEISDSGRYREAISITATAKQKLELRAADHRRPTVLMSGDLEISGGADSEVTLNGLLIARHGLTVPPTADNHLARLRLRHCTLVPGLGFQPDGSPENSAAPSLIVRRRWADRIRVRGRKPPGR